MSLKLNQILKLLNVIISFENDKNLKPISNEIEKIFNDLPIYEATRSNFDELVKFCIDCKLIARDQNLLQTTSISRELINSGQSENYLNEKQCSIFAEKCFLEGFYSYLILEKLSKFNIDANENYWYPSDQMTSHFGNSEILPILYDCNLLQLKNKKVFLNSFFLSILKPKFMKLEPRKLKISQEQIDVHLKNMKIVGEIGEDIVFLYEKTRLNNLGLVDESKKIELLTKNFTNAGYDLKSFSLKTENFKHDRFIEVKSSTGQLLDFHWSKNELCLAKKLQNNYWIYFVPGINIESRKTKSEIIMIQNPYERIFENSSYAKVIDTYHIFLN